MSIAALVVSRSIALLTSEDFRLSLLGVIIFVNEDTSTHMTEFKWFRLFFLVVVSLARLFSTEWGC